VSGAVRSVGNGAIRALCDASKRDSGKPSPHTIEQANDSVFFGRGGRSHFRSGCKTFARWPLVPSALPTDGTWSSKLLFSK
jgi:hypothetical protein